MNKTIKFSSIISRPILAFEDRNRRSLETNAEKQIQNKTNVNRIDIQDMAHNKQEIIQNIISILSESKNGVMFDSGVADEYVVKYRQRLPPDWTQIAEESDGIVVEVNSYSNTTKTLISLPVKKKQSSVKSSTCLTSINEQSMTAFEKEINSKNAIKANKAINEMSVRNDNAIKANKAMNEMSVRTDDSIKANKALNEMSVRTDNPMTANKAMNEISVGTDESMAANSEMGFRSDKEAVETQTSALNNTEAGGDDVIFGGKPIPKPVLPNVKPVPRSAEDFFDLVVLLAATPNHFIVIPFENINSSSKFNQIKQSMHDLYEREENRIELPENVITKGLYFAGKFRHMWFRIQVKEIINRNPFQVMCLLVDYGEIQTFDLKDIQPLYNEFRDLPIQAIRASLASAEPKGSDWDVMACVEFRKMVENRSFVATVFDIKEIDGEPVLSVSLCDTSDSNDVYIGQSLVEKGLAKLKIKCI